MNRKKKILIISNGFYPEISPRSFRATELAKEFCRQGHTVSVITKFRDHDYSGFLKDFHFTIKMWNITFPVVPDLKVKPFSVVTKALSRIMMVLFEYPAIEDMFRVKKLLKNETGYDMMISLAVPFPVHWGVAWARSAKNNIAGTWIADCGDPYMFARLDRFRKPFYFKYFEKFFCRKCNFITIPFREMQSQFYPEFLSKIKVIPQGFNFDEIRLYNGPWDSQKPVFVFAGSVIPGKRDLSLFLEFLSGCTMDFHFIVYTNKMDWFSKFKTLLGDKLEVRGYIERLALLYEMSKADFLVNVDTVFDSLSNTEAVPSKLIDYALTGRPILNISSAYLNEELVIEFLNRNYQGRRVIEKSRYDIRQVSAEFLEFIK